MVFVCVRSAGHRHTLRTPGSSSRRLRGKAAGRGCGGGPAEAPCTRTCKAGDSKMDLHARRGPRSIGTDAYGSDRSRESRQKMNENENLKVSGIN